MSIDSARVFCTGCDYETREVHQPIRVRYETTYGVVIETSRAKGWCYNCNGYTDIERVNLQELHDEMAAQQHDRDEASSRYENLEQRFLSSIRNRFEKRELVEKIEAKDKKIAELNSLVDMVNSRKAGARCLKCWSDRTALLVFGGESNMAQGFYHECGGSLKMERDSSGVRYNFRVAKYVLNEEGEFLRKE